MTPFAKFIAAFKRAHTKQKNQEEAIKAWNLEKYNFL